MIGQEKLESTFITEPKTKRVNIKRNKKVEIVEKVCYNINVLNNYFMKTEHKVGDTIKYKRLTLRGTKIVSAKIISLKGKFALLDDDNLVEIL